MKKIIVFAGTTEGRTLSEGLAARGVSHIMCIATEYGELVIKENPLVSVHRGRMNRDEMCSFIKENGNLVYDATHPFALEVTENIMEACSETGAKYIRIIREDSKGSKDITSYSGLRYFDDIESCFSALKETKGNILLTTGSKDLNKLPLDEDLINRVYARVLPSGESLDLCHQAGIEGKRVIAMQGPFDLEMNKALIKQFQIETLVTKDSGTTGGFLEKLEASKDMGIGCFVVGRPVEEEGISVDEALKEYGEGNPATTLLNENQGKSMKISLIGIGPGREDLLTKEGAERIENADLVFGAERMVMPYRERKKVYPYYLAKDVIPVIEEERPGSVSILFSGDSGFYSGAKKMKETLEEAFDGSVEILPGISSLSYFAAKIGLPYSDGIITSTHGKGEEGINELVSKVRHNRIVFTLLSGKEDVEHIFKSLKEFETEGSSISSYLGYALSYDEERIIEIGDLNVEELNLEEGLYVAAFINESFNSRKAIFPTIDDEDFIRDKVPMTKSAIRDLSILRLNLEEGDVVYDVGSGTGSIAVQTAGISDTIKVYAIEKKKEAVELTGENAKKFGRANVTIVEGLAPDAFGPLEAPNKAFIGGSSGNLKEIVEALYLKNPKVHLVINAISLETLGEITSIIKERQVKNLSIEQIGYSRSKSIGDYHMMMAENPVFIVAFDFGEGEPSDE